MHPAIKARVDHGVQQVGWGIIAVGGQGKEIPFAYTVGMKLLGLPDLLLIAGLSPENFHFLLNTLGAMAQEAGGFKHNDEVRLGDASCALKLIAASDVAKEVYTIQAGQYYGTEDYEVLQVLIPDPAGRFPGDPRCAPPFNSSPVLHKVH